MRLVAQEVHGNKAETKETKKLEEALVQVRVHDHSWRIFALSKKDWYAPLTERQKKDFAGQCYTSIVDKTTFCNAEWLGRADIHAVAKAIGHEYGHIICQCADHRQADAISSVIVR